MVTKARLPMKVCSPRHFAIFRIILGCYLICHFIPLIPYAAEMFSDKGLMADASLNPTNGIFPNILKTFDSPVQVQYFIVLLIVLSVVFTLGFARQVVSLLLWYGWVCLFDRNNLISNPGLPFIGWLLLVCAVIPRGEPLSPGRTIIRDWKFPPLLYKAAWVIMAMSYSLSGVDKLLSPSWTDGTAIIHLLENPLARDWGLRELLLSLPETVLHIMTWSILLMEVLFLPLALFPQTRAFAWFGMVAMHFGILLIVDFADLTIGMLMIHVLTFNKDWLSRRSNAQKNLFLRRTLRS